MLSLGSKRLWLTVVLSSLGGFALTVQRPLVPVNESLSSLSHLRSSSSPYLNIKGMDSSHKKYKTIALLLLAVAVTVQFFVVQVVLKSPFKNDFFTGSIVFILSNSFLYGGIASVPLYLYEKYLWKIIDRNNNFNGTWEYYVTYHSVNNDRLKWLERKRLKELLVDISSHEGKVKIIQSLFNISFVEGNGTVGAGKNTYSGSWSSVTAAIEDKGMIINHFQSKLGVYKFDGVDYLTVAERDNKSQRPTKITGFFKMIPENDDVVLRGQVTYTRIGD